MNDFLHSKTDFCLFVTWYNNLQILQNMHFKENLDCQISFLYRIDKLSKLKQIQTRDLKVISKKLNIPCVI